MSVLCFSGNKPDFVQKVEKIRKIGYDKRKEVPSFIMISLWLKINIERIQRMSNEEQNYKPTKMTLVIRIAVGFYLLYTAYSLIGGILASTGNEKLFLLIAAVAFVFIGVLLVFFAGRSLMDGNYAASSKNTEEAAKEQTMAEPEGAPEETKELEEAKIKAEEKDPEKE